MSGIKEKIGEVFSAAADNKPIAGCTVSKEVYGENGNYISYFSLAKDTDISAEIYGYNKLILVHKGKAEIYFDKNSEFVSKNKFFITPTNAPVGIRTDSETVYTEIGLRSDTVMNNAVKIGEVFGLSELVPYQDGKIVNMDVLHNDKMKFVVMSFDAGTGLSEHAAPGEAVIFALDGEAVIGYEGKEHRIKAGEQFCFANGGKHFVKAEKKFKMALLLTLN